MFAGGIRLSPFVPSSTSCSRRVFSNVVVTDSVAVARRRRESARSRPARHRGCARCGGRRTRTSRRRRSSKVGELLLEHSVKLAACRQSNRVTPSSRPSGCLVRCRRVWMFPRGSRRVRQGLQQSVPLRHTVLHQVRAQRASKASRTGRCPTRAATPEPPYPSHLDGTGGGAIGPRHGTAWLPAASAEGRPARAMERARFGQLALVLRFVDGEAVDVDLIDYH